MELRKQNVSLRMSSADLRKIKMIASRLYARDSDVFRFAIKTALARLAPLHELNAKGAELLPLFTEFGPELTNYFELDTDRLETIVNGDLSDSMRRVERGDLELLALAGQEEHYAMIKLRELARRPVNDENGVASMLREYLFDKYIAATPVRP
ncbi:MAG: hypothetical protein HY273_04410 [Gammaproteobacteria bacterium]|nr:hypothetical protein [Gammaproteobacteria bacterium]